MTARWHVLGQFCIYELPHKQEFQCSILLSIKSISWDKWKFHKITFIKNVPLFCTIQHASLIYQSSWTKRALGICHLDCLLDCFTELSDWWSERNLKSGLKSYPILINIEQFLSAGLPNPSTRTYFSTNGAAAYIKNS